MGSWQVTTNQEPGQKNINTSKMKAVIQLLCLVGVSWAMAMPHLIEPKNAKMVNELMDVIESGLDTPKAGEGRALFISLTLTSTMTNLDTTTVTSTVTPSCVAGTFTECTTTTTTTTSTTTTTTTTTTVAPGRRKRAAGSKEEFLEVIHDITQGAKVVVDGVEMDSEYLNVIMPSKVERDYTYSDLEADLVMNSEAPNLQSGSISWSEAQVLNNGRKSPCGRSDHDEDHEHRARIILPVNEQVQLNLTSTATATATATDTVTFSVQLATCTSSGFTFAVPMC